MGFSSFFGVWDNLGSVMLWNLSENLTAAVKYLNYTTRFYFKLLYEAVFSHCTRVEVAFKSCCNPL